MNNVTTFETSQRLKAAGFPQPVPEFGQVWYAHDAAFFNYDFQQAVVTGTYKSTVHHTFINGAVRNCEAEIFLEFFFAPTATDIWRELGVDYNTKFMHGYFFVGTFDIYIGVNNYDAKHKNHAEALAKKWLSLNEKQNEK